MSGYAQWSPYTTYVLNDIVAFDGLIYICIQGANLNHQPNSSPTWWASNGGGSTITSVSAGAGIAVSGSTAITITNTGVRTLASGGTGITIGGTTTDRTVSNTGVLSITAGTNCSIGGTAQDPIINATTQTSVGNGKVSYTEFVFDAIGTPITIPANQLGNAFVYCNTPNAQAQTLYLPNITALTAQFGANAVVNFFIGQLNVVAFNPLYADGALLGYITSPTGNEYWCNNYITQPPTSPLKVNTWSAFTGSVPSVHYPALYKVQLTIQGGKAFYYFDYAGFSFP